MSRSKFCVGLKGIHVITPIHSLQKISIGQTSGNFIIQGTEREIMNWLSNNQTMEIVSFFDEFYVTLIKVTESNAMQVYGLEVFKAVTPGGGAMSKIVGALATTNWQMEFRAKPVHSNIKHIKMRKEPYGMGLGNVTNRFTSAMFFR